MPLAPNSFYHDIYDGVDLQIEPRALVLADHQGHSEATEAADHEIGDQLDVVARDLLELTVVDAFFQNCFDQGYLGGIELTFEPGHKTLEFDDLGFQYIA